MAREDVTRALDEAGAEYEVLPHAHTETALAEAKALGIDPAEVGKTLVVETPQGYARAVVPADCRIDFNKLRDVLGGPRKKIHLASEETLEHDYTEFELGAVSPFGGMRRDRVVVDRRVTERDSVVVEAGTHDTSLRLSTKDLIRVTQAEVADICAE